jgi:predicted acetyltransferase
MSGFEETSSVVVEIVRATREQEFVLANLLELYAHDFSEFSKMEIGEDGRFGYPHLSLYWKEPDLRHPFLIKADGKLAGFVLLQKGSQAFDNKETWDVAEFFILRGYRRRGLGVKAAHAVWHMFPGKWEVRVMERNSQAREFWQRALYEFTGETVRAALVEKSGRRWHVFSFQS